MPHRMATSVTVVGRDFGASVSSWRTRSRRRSRMYAVGVVRRSERNAAWSVRALMPAAAATAATLKG